MVALCLQLRHQTVQLQRQLQQRLMRTVGHPGGSAEVALLLAKHAAELDRLAEKPTHQLITCIVSLIPIQPITVLQFGHNVAAKTGQGPIAVRQATNVHFRTNGTASVSPSTSFILV